MYIDFKNFKLWLNKVNLMNKAISPGGLATELEVSRQTIHSWINDSVIDAYRYSGIEGNFVVIDLEDSLDRVKAFKNK